MREIAADVLAYYRDHPISAARILAALGVVPDRPLAPERLWPFDQDHYGGVGAVAELARRAGVGPGASVLDLGAGLAGPARFLARRHAARVTALELAPGRCRDAVHLNRLTGLTRAVAVVRGDAARLPFRAAVFTAAISQEGLLHVPDKVAALRECARVLVPGGRLALTDWVATPRLGEGERAWLARTMAAVALPTREDYRALLGAAGFVAIELEDLSAEWLAIVRRRREVHRALAAAGAAAPGPAPFEAYDRLHAAFAELLVRGRLAGLRVSATCARAGV